MMIFIPIIESMCEKIECMSSILGVERMHRIKAFGNPKSTSTTSHLHAID